QMEDLYANAAAGASSTGERNAISGQMMQALQDAADAGWISQTDAVQRRQRYLGRVDSIAARAIISSDPDGAIEILADPGQFANLSDTQRGELLSYARKLATARRPNEDDETVVTAEMRTARVDEGLDLLRQGQLTADWVDGAEELGRADLNAFKAAAE